MIGNWNETDTKQLIELLGRLPAHRPEPIFYWLCANTVGIPVEGIFLREKGNWFTKFLRRAFRRKKIEVLLKRRPANDPVYSNQLAVIGTMIKSEDVLSPDSDSDWNHPVWCYKGPLTRILAEAGLTEFDDEPRIATTRLFMGDRGPVNQVLMLCTVPDDGVIEGEWYDVKHLPHDIIGEHISLIVLATKHL